ncbi:MAG: GAF domain-containing sensor histidine kinase [Proteobacteria bacterium]|nr:GAF domain-containing sensor histidine kinase [Pseudomonadota bacterium]
MSTNEKILNAIIEITQISNNSSIDFNEKMSRVLMCIVKNINTAKGSIMIVKGRNKLEVVASTNQAIIGLKQPLDSNSPSARVFKTKKPLYSQFKGISQSSEENKNRYQKDAFYIIPVFSNKKVIGVINLTDKIGEDAFSEQEQELLLDMSGYFISTIETHRLAENLKENRKSLRKKNQQLKKLEKLRSDLFHMLIHDLKGPISEVVANLDILTYTASEENMEYVTAAQSGCDTLFRMISDLLDIARLEEGTLDLINEKLIPNDLIKEAISRLPAFAKIKNVTFVTKFPDIAHKSVDGDRSLLLRVLQNLIINAIDYSHKGEKIEIGYELDDNEKIAFFVKDNGPGIPPEYQDAIFDKYYQAKNKRHTIIYSTGLGLAFCKLAVEAHRGTIFVKSDGLNGSRFEFSIN